MIINSLLSSIEREATKVLNDDGRRFIAGLTESQFNDFYSLQKESNTPKQANAIGALRAIEVIRSLTHVLDNHGYLMCDPRVDHTYDSLTVSQLLLETATLILAAVRGEAWEDHWPSVQQEYQRTRARSAERKRLVFEMMKYENRKSAHFIKKRLAELGFKVDIRTVQRDMKDSRDALSNGTK